ncbi:putative transmembrane protein [Collimonas arenae]|uniref:Putative transmembrane protein n=1 Tax=Collimonas arenae TaxID=279058 RepID=A0A0A1F8J6_9BURK|nr:hypothetical protein [Collimonas arenae]AIY41058.1 putative transmembrane protein [Collimonas arenae]
MLKLTAFFSSPSIAVRSITWLITFLLLTMLWVFLLRFLPVNGLFHYLGTLGMTGTQTIMAITLLPPLALSLLSWIGLQVFTPPAAAPNVAPVQPPTEAIVDAPVEMPRIAAWSAVTPFGDAAATIASSQEQEKIFRPDHTIRNTEGHPVHAAMVEKLPLEVLDYPVETRSRAMRITAMLVTVLDTLFDQREELAQSGTAPVSVYWLVPEALPLDNETRLCFSMAWTHSSWRNVGFDLHLLPAATESAYGAVNALQQHMSNGKMPYVLLLAADSLVNPDELLSPLALDQVFSSKITDGFVPAEGAAGLLLVDAAFAAHSQMDALCSLGTVQRALRTSDRTAKGKADSSTLTTCITKALEASKIEAGEIGNVISDTDHRFSRTAEVIDAIGQTLPELDPLSQRIAPMAYAGSFGVASDLIHIALAAEMATATEQATLVVSVAEARQTNAMMVLPVQA